MSPGHEQTPHLTPDASTDAILADTYQKARDLLTEHPLRAALLLEGLAPHVAHLGPALHLDTALAFARADMPQAAQAHLQQAQRLGAPEDNLHALRLRLAVSTNQYPKAWRALLALQKAMPKLNTAACQDVMALLSSPDKPSDELQQIWKDPAHSERLRSLPALCRHSGVKGLSQAHKTWRKPLPRAITPGPVQQLYRIRDKIARVDNEGARKALEAMLLKGPKRKRKPRQLPPEAACEAPFLMARVLTRLRRPSDARPWYLQALEACSQDLAEQSPKMRTLLARAR